MLCSNLINHEKNTLVAQACAQVPGFEALYDQMVKHLSITGKSESTLKNYAHHVAKIALHFGVLPTELDEDQINDYLYMVQQQHQTPSESYFKFTVYGLRFAFRVSGHEELRLGLPGIKRDKRLPVVLSRQEVKRLLKAPKLLKHRVLLALLYGCGLRCFEVRNLRLNDLDFDRKMLLVRQGKGKKSRYLPLSEHLIRGLKTYIYAEKPQQWLFSGKQEVQGRSGGAFDSRYSQRGVQWAVKQARKAAEINKEMTVHTLRHTYATHLLEEGLDIMTIKDLLGHSCIDTTLVYLHVAQSGRVKPFSPLDRLYSKSTASQS